MNGSRLLQLFVILAFIIPCGSSVQADDSTDLPTVAIITTGGTIAEKMDAVTGGAVPAVAGADLIKAVPALSTIANIKVINFSNIDSSQMTPEMWARLSQTVDTTLEDPKTRGAVIIHGTDTMAEGAYFLDLTLKSEKPVVFTGAMRNDSDVSPDGPANILNAVIQACSDESKGWGVTVTLNQYINSARNVRKTHTSNVQTFDSGEKGYLGCIAMGQVVRFNDGPERQKLPLPDELPEVVLVSEYAGADGGLVRHAVDSGARGIVVEALGAGNVNGRSFQAIQYAIGKGIPVVIATRVYNGGVLPVYADQGGGATLEKAGAILAGDLTPAKARLLLMLAIPQAEGDRNKLKEFFQ